MSSDARSELLRLVTFLMSGEGAEVEQDRVLTELESLVPHPRVPNLIYWPSHEGYDRELAADEVVDIALAYRPIEL